MSGSGGWTTNSDQLLRWQLLPWVAEQTDPEPDTRQFIEETGYTEDQLMAAVRDFQQRGWRNSSERRFSSGPTDIALSTEGETAARELLDGRRQRGARAVAAQEALLDWVHDDEYGDRPRQPNPEDFLGDIRAHYYGESLTEAEVLNSAAALNQLEQITGVGSAQRAAPLRLRLTSKGLETVQRGGKLYPEQPSPSITYNTEFHERVGAVAQGSNIEQVVNFGIDAEGLATAFLAVQEAIGFLPEEHRQEATRQLVVIQAEAEDRFEDPNIARQKFARLKTLGANGGNVLFTTAVSQLGTALGQIVTGR